MQTARQCRAEQGVCADGNCARPGQSVDAGAAGKRGIERDGEQRHGASQQHGPPGIAARVKGAHGDGLQRPAGNRQRKNLQSSGDRGRILQTESAAHINQPHQRLCCAPQPRAGQHPQREHHLHGALHQRGELCAAPLLVQTRERGQRGGAHGLPHQSHGRLHEAARKDQRGNGAGFQSAAEPAVEPLVHRQQGHAGQQRQRQRGEAQKAGVARRKAQAPQANCEAPPRLPERRAQRPQRRAHQRAPGKARNAQRLGSQQAKGDDAQVVDQRRSGLGGEAAVRHQARAQQPARHEENLRGQNDAREPHRQRLLLGRKAAELQRDQRLGEHKQQHRGQSGQRRQRAEHGVKKCAGGGFAIALQRAAVEGNEGHRKRRRGQDVVQQVGKLKGGVVGVRLRAAPHLRGEGNLAQQAQRPRQQLAAAEQQCGKTNAPCGFRNLRPLVPPA